MWDKKTLFVDAVQAAFNKFLCHKQRLARYRAFLNHITQPVADFLSWQYL